MLTAKQTLICSLAFANASYALVLNHGEEVANDVITDVIAVASAMPVQDDAEGAEATAARELRLHLVEASASEACRKEVAYFLQSLPPQLLVGSVRATLEGQAFDLCEAGGAPWEALLKEAADHPLKDLAAAGGHALAPALAAGEEGTSQVLAQALWGDIGYNGIVLKDRIGSAASGDNGEACWRRTDSRGGGVLRTSCHHLPGQEFRGLGELGFCYPEGSGGPDVFAPGYTFPWATAAACPETHPSLEGGLCYPWCPAHEHCIADTAWRKCGGKYPLECGALCTDDAARCFLYMATIAMDTFQLVVSAATGSGGDLAAAALSIGSGLANPLCRN